MNLGSNKRQKKLARNQKNKKAEKFEKLMGWLPSIVISFITTLTYLCRIFWFRGMADYYNMDSIYIQGNYPNTITDVLLSIAGCIIVYGGFYKIYEWFVSKKGIGIKLLKIIEAILGLAMINFILVLCFYDKSMNIYAKILLSIFASIIEYIIYMPFVIISYNDIHKRNRKKISWSSYIIIFVIWLVSLCWLSHNLAYEQMSKLKQYEVIQTEIENKVIVAKYQDMFYTYNCEIKDRELIIYPDESEMLDMRNNKVKKIDFDKVTVK